MRGLSIALCLCAAATVVCDYHAVADVALIGMSYSGASDSGNIWRIDPTTGTTSSFATGYLAGGVVGSNFTVQGNFAYATSENSLNKWDLTTGVRTTTGFVPYLNALRANSDGSLIGMSYSGASDSGNIWRIDPVTGVTTSFATGYLSGGINGSNFTVQGMFAYGTSQNTLTRWDLTNGVRTDTNFAPSLNATVGIPAPSTAALLALIGLAARGRRRC
jgi:MprA protease rhombosortase-interaction domain-containing protein